MSSRLKEIFEDEKLVNRIKTRLPYLFQLAELESSRAVAGSVEAILTLFFLSVFGIARVFHLEDLSDPGFAILNGRNGVLSRTTLLMGKEVS